jgi:hypothetical protein
MSRSSVLAPNTPFSSIAHQKKARQAGVSKNQEQTCFIQEDITLPTGKQAAETVPVEWTTSMIGRVSS